MDSRKIVSTGKITRDFIAGVLFFGTIFMLGLGSLMLVVTKNMNTPNDVLKTVVTIVCNFVITLLVCYCSIKSAFRKNTVENSNAKKLMKNIIIFFIILLLIVIIYNFYNTSSQIKQLRQSDELTGLRV